MQIDRGLRPMDLGFRPIARVSVCVRYMGMVHERSSVGAVHTAAVDDYIVNNE